MFSRIGAGEIILVLAVLLLLFGARKLPELARSLGRSARELRKGMQEDVEDEVEED
jgi:sec-independent protein translocase protein TatA